VAVVVARGEVDGDPRMGRTAERVAPHERLHDVRFTDALPRTPVGKLLRRELRDPIGRNGRRPSASEGRRTKAQYV
jgi:acyl-coenzyme A synthetase/AMP-(fatty) acid ligase